MFPRTLKLYAVMKVLKRSTFSEKSRYAGLYVTFESYLQGIESCILFPPQSTQREMQWYHSK